MASYHIAAVLLLTSTIGAHVAAAGTRTRADADLPAPIGLTAPQSDAPAPLVASEGFLSNTFGDHMVFQAGAPIVIWGSVPMGTFVSVIMSPGNGRASGVGDQNGHWRAALPTVTTGGPYTITASTATGLNTTLLDVLVGTVLLCSGQSNLSGATTPLSYLFNGTESAAEAASMPWVRLFTVGERATQGLLPPQVQLGYAPRLNWTVGNASAAAGFSGVCWMAAKVLARTLGPKQPIGIIETAWSGTCIQAWLPADALASCGPVPQAQGWQTNSTLFNQMVAPFANTAGSEGSGMAISGVLWYQGESNAIYYKPGYYACALAALLKSWRTAFNSPTAWFGVVQVAPWSGYGVSAVEAADVRAAELAVVLADAHATLATAVDLGDVNAPQGSIHPRPKQALGARLAAGALFDLFGIGTPEEVRGPVAVAATSVPGGGASVTFAPPFNTPGSIVLDSNVTAWPGLLPTSACPPVGGTLCAGFALRDGATGVWYNATASLNSDASAVILMPAAGAPVGAIANESALAASVWPQISLFAAAGRGGLPAYPWQLPVSL